MIEQYLLVKETTEWMSRINKPNIVSGVPLERVPRIPGNPSIFERELALLVALLREHIWKAFGDIHWKDAIRRWRKDSCRGSKDRQTWMLK